MRLNAKQICEYVGGIMVVEAIDPSTLMCSVTWDSREVTTGGLFIALEGERSDGHTFVDEVLRSGAGCVLTMKPLKEQTHVLAREMGAAVIEVSNTYSAVTDLARAWRGFLRGTVIGVTGSTGKTTTKDLLRTVLSASYRVVATKDNQNNELGVPRTILNADPETEFIIVEMGMRGRGQITELCAFAQPDIGVITNIGDSHIELLKTHEAIAQAKGELIGCLPDNKGIAILNIDDKWFDEVMRSSLAQQRSLEIIRYSTSEQNAKQADVYAHNISLDEEGKPCFILAAAGREVECRLNLRGVHNVSNAIAASAVAWRIGMDIESIASALEQAEPAVGRQRYVVSRDGVLVVDDAYNASPDSMRAALATFAALEIEGRRIAVLGDMGELGDYAQACHEGIGRYAATLNIDRLICVGELSRKIADAASMNGMSDKAIMRYDSIAEVLSDLEAYVESGDAVLVKASHAMGLERVVGGLIN